MKFERRNTVEEAEVYESMVFKKLTPRLEIRMDQLCLVQITLRYLKVGAKSRPMF